MQISDAVSSKKNVEKLKFKRQNTRIKEYLMYNQKHIL